MFTPARTVSRRHASFARPVLTAAALLAAAGGALADGPVCDPRLPYTMPDLDQVRAAGMGVMGLPNNGTQYCVPTCTMNILKYLTNHGYPSLNPGSGPWLGGNAVYNQMTTAIQQLAVQMNTDPFGGTGGNNAFAGVNQWINASGLQGDIVVTTKGVSATDAPELGDFALAMLLDCPTSASVGWYSESPTGVLTRTGGHCVSVVRLPNFCSPTRQISIRDPGNGGDQFTQQVGSTDTYNIQTRNVVIMKDGSPLYNGPIERTAGYGSGHIDGYRIFNPAFGIAACNNPINGSCVATHMPETVLTNQPQSTHFDLPGQAVLDLDLLPSNLRFVAIVAGETPSAPNQLLVADRAGGDPVPVPTPFSPTRVATGDGEGRLFVLDSSGTSLHMVDWRGGRVGLESIQLPAPASALCFDDRNDQVVLLSSQERRVMGVRVATGDVNSNLPLPPNVVLGANPRISVCPVGSYIWLTSGTPVATGLMSDAAGLSIAATIRTNDPTPPAFNGVDSDDRGHVYTFADGELIEFAPPAEPDGPWTQVPESKFAPLADGGLFRIARSRSNLVPEIHDSPEWTLSVLPTEFGGESVPDCIADWNQDGVVNSRDISAFLTDWLTSVGAADLAADFDGDGTTNSADISAFLQAWINDLASGHC